MTVKIPGYTTVSGRPQAILKLLKDAQIFEDLADEYNPQEAENALRELSEKQRIIIEEDIS